MFRAIAGIWDAGEGRIVRPKLDSVLFLPERPHLPPGTLREVLLPTGQEQAIDDEQISSVLSQLNLQHVLEQSGGLDTEKDWDDILSIGEQQGLAFARLLLAAPQFVFLDRPHTVLGPSQLDQILRLLHEYSITYITLGGTEDAPEHYDGVVQLAEDGEWKWQPIPAGQA